MQSSKVKLSWINDNILFGVDLKPGCRVHVFLMRPKDFLTQNLNKRRANKFRHYTEYKALYKTVMNMIEGVEEIITEIGYASESEDITASKSSEYDEEIDDSKLGSINVPSG